MKHILLSLALTVFGGISVFADVPPVVGHRGNSSVAPENTLSAYRSCIEVGAQGAECDLYRTTDGKLVLQHDKTLKRNVRDAQGSPAAGFVTDYSLAELRTMDFGVWKGEQFKGEKVATFEEFLDLLKGASCVPVIELKQPGLEADVIAAIRAKGMEKESIIITSFSDSVKECYRLAPEIKVAYLCKRGKKETNDQYTNRLIAKLKEINTTYVDMEHIDATPEFVKKLHDNGITVMVWTADDPERIKALFDMGVDSITTNVPATAVEIYKK